MWMQTFFKSLTSTSTLRRPPRRRPSPTQLRLEALEDRCLPSFSMPVDYGAGLSPLAVVSADFNGDGRLDLATANNDNNTVSVLLGNGDGTFQAPRTSTAGAGYPSGSLVAADLNRDGNADLVTFNQFSTNITLLLGNGDGTFQSPQSIALPAQLPPGWTGPDYLVQYLDWNGTDPLAQYLGALAVGDMNGDGTLDLVAGGTAGYTTVTYPWLSDPEYQHYAYNYANVLFGNGDGTFSPAVVKPVAGGFPLHPGDFNNDGRLDIVLNGGTALGNGDGTLQDVVQSSVYVGGESQSVGDLNGDGNLDVLSNVSHVGGPYLQLGNGDGTFQQGQNLDNNYYQWGTVAGDGNADGKLDVVSLWSDYEWSEVYDGYAYIIATTRSARVLLGNSNGSFSQPIIVDLGTVAAQADFMSPVLADFDGDGFPDLAMIERFTSDEGAVVYRGVHVALNDGNWTLPPPPPPSMTVSDVTITEGNTGTVSAIFTVILSGAYDQTVTVNFASADGTASAGSDYAATSGTLTFVPGETSKTITVLIHGDRLVEPDETIFVNLSNATNGIIVDGPHVCTITDNEPRISISDFSKAEGKKGQTTLFTFTVTLSAAYDQVVTMSFRTVNGTATTSDNDYIAKTGTLTFAPGETTKTITIEVKGDSKKEANETFYLDLFGNSSNSLFTKNRGLGTILNDD